MKKTLKSIKSKFGMLNEAYAWERQEGQPLPTLADVQRKHNAKPVNEQSSNVNKHLDDLETAIGHMSRMYGYIKELYDTGKDLGDNTAEIMKAKDKIYDASYDLEIIGDKFGVGKG